MRNIWMLTKIVAPAAIAYFISLYLDGQRERIAVLILGLAISFIQFVNNSSITKLINKEVAQLRGLLSNLKRKHHFHIKEPHIIASATIKTNGTVSVENGFNISSVTDVSSNEVHFNIANPSGKSVIPNVNTDAKQHVSVVATPTTIKVSWDESCPNVIYMTAIYGE